MCRAEYEEVGVSEALEKEIPFEVGLWKQFYPFKELYEGTVALIFGLGCDFEYIVKRRGVVPLFSRYKETEFAIVIRLIDASTGTDGSFRVVGCDGFESANER